MKKFFTKEVKIAITVIISLAVLFWGIEYLKGVNLFKPANFYYVEFKNVAGLTEEKEEVQIISRKGFSGCWVRK